jgi:hypothetical protein
MVVTITTSDVVAPLLIFSFIVMYRGKEGARGVEHHHVAIGSAEEGEDGEGEGEAVR